MGVCCGCDSKQDILTEIKKSSVAEGSAAAQNSRLIFTEATNAEQILLKRKENPLKDYSLLLFQELNKFRTEPQKFYSESLKYNFDDIVNELIILKNQKKDLKLEWSTKKEIVINNIMNDESIKDIRTKLGIIKQKFESIFDLIIIIVQGSYDNVNESLWEALSNFKEMDEKKFKNIILGKIDYCVIYSIKSDDLIIKKLNKEDGDDDDIDIDIEKDEEKDDDEYDNKETDKANEKIISLYFIFNHLDEDDKSYNNIINNNVVCW